LVFLLKRTLPELFNSSYDSNDVLDEQADSMGTAVNIVLPGGDELPSDLEPVEPGYADAASPGDDQGQLEPLSARSGSRDEAAEFQPGMVHASANVRERTASVADQIGSAGAQAADISALTREVGEIRQNTLVSDDVASESPRAASGNSGMLRPRVSVDDLDVLPDLDSLSSSFADIGSGNSDVEDSAASDVSYSSGSFSGGASSTKGGEDPVVIAKAVQTLLRRDQKGQ
ncbi:MAG: hypothetical protein KKC64_12045, partial [Spirochaetes bacterium]|nr:hypothetical protein [Spirochaetota bacterium]